MIITYHTWPLFKFSRILQQHPGAADPRTFFDGGAMSSQRHPCDLSKLAAAVGSRTRRHDTVPHSSKHTSLMVMGQGLTADKCFFKVKTGFVWFIIGGDNQQ